MLAGSVLGMLVAALSQTIVATALPTLVGEVGGQDQRRNWCAATVEHAGEAKGVEKCARAVVDVG